MRRPLAQLLAVLFLTTAWTHLVEGRFTPWNPAVLFAVPFVIGILSNKGFARLAMGTSLILASTLILYMNVILFGWAD